MEGDYSTVDEDPRIFLNERLSVEGNYSTVDEDMPKTSKNRISMDGDYSTVELDEQIMLQMILALTWLKVRTTKLSGQ
jgi:hypothetical protein